MVQTPCVCEFNSKKYFVCSLRSEWGNVTLNAVKNILLFYQEISIMKTIARLQIINN